jgi:hypothetical protein
VKQYFITSHLNIRTRVIPNLTAIFTVYLNESSYRELICSYKWSVALISVVCFIIEIG